MSEPLGVHMLLGETLLAMLWEVHRGSHPDVVYAEMYASAEQLSEDDSDERDE